jgi:hypothetical protein
MDTMDIATKVEELYPRLPEEYHHHCQNIANYLRSGADWNCFLAIIETITMMDKSVLTNTHFMALSAITSLRGDRTRAVADFNFWYELLKVRL